ncbi:MAG TPA: (2Fe-2S)-binding protein [Phycisphaerales bacterium]|nr:(2Fe-2S)-binding protein [Phycisphaerales bacterium]
MDPDDHVCLCFRVSLRKIRAYLRREDPPVASLISECLGAGTGCQWCVPFLKHLHAQHQRGEEPDLKISPQRYSEARASYRASGERDAHVVREVTAESPGTATPGSADPGAADEMEPGA